MIHIKCEDENEKMIWKFQKKLIKKYKFSFFYETEQKKVGVRLQHELMILLFRGRRNIMYRFVFEFLKRYIQK